MDGGSQTNDYDNDQMGVGLSLRAATPVASLSAGLARLAVAIADALGGVTGSVASAAVGHRHGRCGRPVAQWGGALDGSATPKGLTRCELSRSGCGHLLAHTVTHCGRYF